MEKNAAEKLNSNKISPLFEAPSGGTDFTIQWRNLSYMIPDGRIFHHKNSSDNRKINILQNLSGHFKSGHVTAIMGPSGKLTT